MWIAIEPLLAAAMAFGLTLFAMHPDHPLVAETSAATQRIARLAPESTLYFPNCAMAQSMGYAPIYRGQPGYSPHLDRDNDGVACEPWPRRR